MKKDKWFIAWQSKLTGKAGRGKPCTKKIANAWAKQANKQYPNLEHWTLPAMKETNTE